MKSPSCQHEILWWWWCPSWPRSSKRKQTEMERSPWCRQPEPTRVWELWEWIPEYLLVSKGVWKNDSTQKKIQKLFTCSNWPELPKSSENPSRESFLSAWHNFWNSPKTCFSPTCFSHRFIIRIPCLPASFSGNACHQNTMYFAKRLSPVIISNVLACQLVGLSAYDLSASGVNKIRQIRFNFRG